jgi:hypothetical protein
MDRGELTMHRIIKGKKYDTDTATELIHSLRESLYRTQNGAYFLYRVHHTPSFGTSSCESKDIIAMTEQEARDWVEIHHNDKYEDTFGPAPEA